MPLGNGHAESPYCTAVYLLGQTLRMNHRAAVSYTNIVENLKLTRIQINFDFGHRDHQPRCNAALGQVVPGHPNQTAACEAPNSALGNGMDIIRILLTAILTTHGNCPSCGLPVGHAQGFVVTAENPFASNAVIFRITPQFRGGNFLQFLYGILGGNPVGPGVSKYGVTAPLCGTIGQVQIGVPAHDFAVIPISLQNFCSRPHGVCIGIRSEVPDPGMQVDTTRWVDTHEPVIAVITSGMISQPDAQASHLAAIARARLTGALRPVKHLGRLIDGLAEEGTGHWPTVLIHGRLTIGRIYPTECHAIHTQLIGGLVHNRCDCSRHLILTRTPLCSARRRVGEDRNIAQAHCRGCINDRQMLRRCGGTVASRWSAIANDDHVHRGNGAIGPQTRPYPALHPGSAYTDIIFLGAGDTELHRPV